MKLLGRGVTARRNRLAACSVPPPTAQPRRSYSHVGDFLPLASHAEHGEGHEDLGGFGAPDPPGAARALGGAGGGEQPPPGAQHQPAHTPEAGGRARRLGGAPQLPPPPRPWPGPHAGGGGGGAARSLLARPPPLPSVPAAERSQASAAAPTTTHAASVTRASSPLRRGVPAASSAPHPCAASWLPPDRPQSPGAAGGGKAGALRRLQERQSETPREGCAQKTRPARRLRARTLLHTRPARFPPYKQRAPRGGQELGPLRRAPG